MPVATISLYDTIKDSGGTPQANVTVSLSFGYNAATDADGLILPSVRTATTDGTGKWTIAQVIPTDLISPSNTVYLVETPFRTYEVAPQSGNGSSQQSTAANVIVNNPLGLAPYTGLIGGAVTFTGLLTAQAGVAVTGGLNVAAGETGIDTIAAGALLIADNTATSVEAGSGATPFALQGDVATRSLTVLASGPYTNTLPGTGGTISTPGGVSTAKIEDYGGQVWNVKAFGAIGDGNSHPLSGYFGSLAAAQVVYPHATSLTNEIDWVAGQAANNAAQSAGGAGSSGGIVYWPQGSYLLNLSITVNDNNVRHMGVGWGVNDAVKAPPTRWTCTNVAMTSLINVVGAMSGISLVDLFLQGGSANTSLTFNAVSIPGQALDVYIERLFFDQVGGSAILWTGTGGTLLNCFTQNCLQGTPIVDTGVFDLNVADMRCSRNFITPSSANYGNGHTFAYAVRSANGFYDKNMAEISQNGWLVTGGGNFWNRFTACRAYACWGTGWTIAASENQYVSCVSVHCGLATDNTYDGFVVTGSANQFTSCEVNGNSGDANQMRHGFTDNNSVGTADYQTNRYSNNYLGSNTRGVLYNVIGGNKPRINHPSVGGVDRGDAAATVQSVVDPESVIYNTPLTAQRRVTLGGAGGTLGAYRGSRFRITRTLACTGAFSLQVFDPNQGTIRLLATGQWTEVEFGGNWQEVAWGDLTIGGPPVVVLVDAATIAIDASLGRAFEVTLGGNRTLGLPTNPVSGQRIHLTVIQDGTGGRTLTTVTNFPKLTWSDTGNTLNKRSTIAAVYDGTNWNQDGTQTPYI